MYVVYWDQHGEIGKRDELVDVLRALRKIYDSATAYISLKRAGFMIIFQSNYVQEYVLLYNPHKRAHKKYYDYTDVCMVLHLCDHIIYIFFIVNTLKKHTTVR